MSERSIPHSNRSPQDLYNLDEVALLLGISRSRARDALERGYLAGTTYREGRRVFTPESIAATAKRWGLQPPDFAGFRREPAVSIASSLGGVA